MEHQNPEQTFRVGEVISTSFSILFRNIVPFGVLSIIVLSPTVLFALPGGGPTLGMSPWQVIALVVTVVLSFAVTGALVYGTSRDLGGHKVGIGECFGRGLATLPPVLGVILLASLAIGIGILLLIVPGIFLYVMWWVAIPIAVIERPGVIASLKRSGELTEGKRWSVFGIAVVIIVINVALGAIGGVIGMAGGYIVGTLVDLVVQAFTAAFGSIVVAVGYYRLRGEKEGVNVESIASVFD